MIAHNKITVTVVSIQKYSVQSSSGKLTKKFVIYRYDCNTKKSRQKSIERTNNNLSYKTCPAIPKTFQPCEHNALNFHPNKTHEGYSILPTTGFISILRKKIGHALPEDQKIPALCERQIS